MNLKIKRKLTQTIFILSLLTIFTSSIFSVRISPEPATQRAFNLVQEYQSKDYPSQNDGSNLVQEDIENQLSESLQQLSISKEQHQENLRFVFGQPGIVENIYEFAFGKTDQDREKYDAIVQAIISSNNRDKGSTVAFFFAIPNAPDDSLKKAALQYRNCAATRSLCKIPFFYEQLNPDDDGKTFLHLIAERNLFDRNTHQMLNTLVDLGVDAFTANQAGLIPIEVTSNEDIKQLLLSAMRKQPYNYFCYKGKAFKHNCANSYKSFKQHCSNSYEAFKQHCKELTTHLQKNSENYIATALVLVLTPCIIMLAIYVKENACNLEDPELRERCKDERSIAFTFSILGLVLLGTADSILVVLGLLVMLDKCINTCGCNPHYRNR